MLISAVCGAIVLSCRAGATGSRLGFTSRRQLIDTAQLAAVFLAGCYTLNGCLAVMHVRLAMVLRAAEPLTTLGLMLPPSEQPTRRRAAALIPVVVGCGLSAIGDHGPTARALFLVGVSNVCFSLRAILGKRVKAAHEVSAVQIFFQMSVHAAGMQALALLCRALCAPTQFRLLSVSAFAERPLLLLLCGVSFFSQLQLSFVCLGRMSAVTHSLANSMRRPATIAAALFFAPAPLSLLNWVGVAIACGGALLYGLL